MKTLLMAIALVAGFAGNLFAQCNAGNQVDFGNANLGRELAASRPTFQPVMEAPVQRIAMKQTSASSSASSAGGLTQPGFLTFQEGGQRLTAVPEINSDCDEASMLRAELAEVRAELAQMRAARQQSQPVFQTAAFQTSAGGTSASSSASSAAPSVNQLALTQPLPQASRQSNVACSSGGCGGRRGFLRLPVRRSTSVSRSFSRTTSG